MLKISHPHRSKVNLCKYIKTSTVNSGYFNESLMTSNAEFAMEI